VTITINGTNDAPVISAHSDGAVTEDVGVAGGNLSDSGDLQFDDVDLADTHTVSVTPNEGNAVGGMLMANIVDFATGGSTGMAEWTYTVANSATQFLEEDQTITETFTVTVTDNHGGFATEIVQVTLTGVNDNATIPVANGDNVITNAKFDVDGFGEPFNIPEWALLANDTNPDGNPLDVQSVGGLRFPDEDSVSWTPGSGTDGFVTFQDNTEFDLSWFTYAATDGQDVSALATVKVTQDVDGVLNGTSGNDILVGATNGSTHFVGNSDTDIMIGGNRADTMNGNNGNDTLAGGGGNDDLTGGAGNDVFDYNATSDSGTTPGTWDMIKDFEAGSDLIDLSGIDADTGSNGNQEFAFEEFQNMLAVNNSVTWFKDTSIDVTIVQGDVDGIAGADFQIELMGLHDLAASDFIL
jgi:VCBS repeat-containing protein